MSAALKSRSGLWVPHGNRQCGACGGSRFWQDLNAGIHCWDCVPPGVFMRKYQMEAKAEVAAEATAVSDFIDEDESIKDFNQKHFGRRIS
jgi:hypothetical protein